MAATGTPTDWAAVEARTHEALAGIWNDMGIKEEERALFKRRLRDNVMAIFHASMAAENSRRDSVAADVETLRKTLLSMQRAMEHAEEVVSSSSKRRRWRGHAVGTKETANDGRGGGSGSGVGAARWGPLGRLWILARRVWCGGHGRTGCMPRIRPASCWPASPPQMWVLSM